VIPQNLNIYKPVSRLTIKIRIMNFEVHLYEGGCNAVSSVNIPKLWCGLLGIHHETVFRSISSPRAGVIGWSCRVRLPESQAVTVTVYANQTLMVQGRKEAVRLWIDSTIPVLLAETSEYVLTPKGEACWWLSLRQNNGPF
jgi:hypothetical protein